MFALALCLLGSQPGQEFYDYLDKPDSSFTYSLDDANKIIHVTSQTWEGNTWQHNVLYELPTRPVAKGVALLFITGGDGTPQERPLVSMLANQCRIPTAVLFGIPNQPLYGGLKEDDLIAYTFQKYIETGDASWPLLFPMTKSALRTMDAIEQLTASTDNPVHKFIISGASKRGWTTWLVGASHDKRVIAIAPMVIDNLNLNRQMEHQKEAWGSYSEQIEAYTKMHFQERLNSPRGKQLAAMVDPYTFRSQIKVPTLIVKGANDPYWTVDALNQYYGDLKQQKWVVTVPNVGHNLGDKLEAVETLGAFARSQAGEFAMPKEKWNMKFDAATGNLSFSLDHAGLTLLDFKVWYATADNFDFRPSKYVSTSIQGTGGNSSSLTIKLPSHVNVAAFGEATYKTEDGHFRLCSPTNVYTVK